MTNTDNQIDDRDLLFEVIFESLQVKSHFELFLWLQGRVQKFLPHDILICAWGDFSLGLVYFDIVSSHQKLRTKNISESVLTPQIKELFNLWLAQQKSPQVLNFDQGVFNNPAIFMDSDLANEYESMHFDAIKSAIFHGIQDNRGSQDCLYILMSFNPIPAGSKLMLEIFMPYIDCVFRRISQLQDEQETIQLDHQDGNLTLREVEIMNCVKEGKTNAEIAVELDISTFTVKNHLQNIYKKLSVTNRSQAAHFYKKS